MNKIFSKKITYFCLITLLLILAFYFRSLFYSIKAYDELALFKETHVPTCFSLSEIIELVSLLGLKQHFESSNALYSSIVSLRCDPFCALLHMLTQLICQKNPFYYHVYGLGLHLLCSLLVFLILNKVSLLFLESGRKIRLFLVSILTILWSTHPVNIESVLLLTNANITLSYAFSLLVFFIFINLFLQDLDSERPSNKILFLLFIFFLLALLIAEFHFMLLPILISYSFAMLRHYKHLSFFSYVKSMKYLITPLLISTLIFVILFLTSHTRMNIESYQSWKLTLERVFWLSPQIIFHFIKLFFYPDKLSIDQTFFVKIARTYFEPYTMFCFGFILILIILSFISLLRANKKFPFLFITIFLFLLSLLPYSQAIAPIYNLASERYLYFPSFIFIFGASHVLFFLISKLQKNTIYIVTSLLVLIQLAYSMRGFMRLLDWKDSTSLYISAINTTDNPLYKAYRYKGLTPQKHILEDYPERMVHPTYKKVVIRNLETAISNLKIEMEKYQSSTPKIVKKYGLDPKTLHAKAGFLLAQANFTAFNDHKKSLEIMEPYTKDLSLLDSAAYSFYASLLFFNEMPDKAEKILKKGYKLFPYSTRIILPLCELTYIKYGDFKEVEKIALSAFKYFPYDSFTLFSLTKIYETKGDLEKFAYYSYIHGLRNHSLKDLNKSYQAYISLNKFDKAEQVKKRISNLEAIYRKKGLSL